MEIMSYVWITAIIILCLAEAFTAQLISIWFGIGAVAALITSAFTNSILPQIIVFILVSFISLLLTRPLLKKVLHFQKEDTNLGRIIGKRAFVLIEINNDKGTGQINVNGSIWAAKSSDGSVIEAGKSVIVENINGVKCCVKEDS